MTRLAARRTGAALVVNIILLVLWTAQVFYRYPLLPADVPQAIDSAGKPCSFMAKELDLVLKLVCIAMFAGMALACRKLVARDSSRLRLPYKEYWLAPERREATLDFIASQGRWLLNVLLAGLVLMSEFAVRPYLPGGKRVPPPPFWMACVCGALFLLWFWLVARRFRNVPRDSGERT